MGSLFGKPQDAKPKNNIDNKDKVNDKDRAILDLKTSRDKLKKYRKRLEQETSKLQDEAKELIRLKKKDRALTVLKIKKYKEKAVDDVDKQLLTVVDMIDTIEWESINLEVLKAIKSGTNTLNKIHEEMPLDEISQLLDETNEAIEIENSINAVLAGQFNPGEESELLEELNQLENMSSKQDIDLPSVPSSVPLPSAPSHIPSVSKNTQNSNPVAA